MSNILNSTQFTENVDMTGAFTLTGSQSISANLSADGTATFAHLVVTDTAIIPGLAASLITFDASGLTYITHGDVQSAIADVHDAMAPSAHTHASLYAALIHTHTAGSFTIIPHGNMTATTLQGALNYLEDNKSQITHTHSGFSLVTHNHDGQYADPSHDHDSRYSLLAHLHTGVYSLIGHDHDADYSALSHDHDLLYAALSHLQTGVYSLIGHDHDAAYSVLSHVHTGVYSLIGHDHDADYSALFHIHAASVITYDNTVSGLIATNVKSAIDEIDINISTLDSDSIGYDSTANDLQSDNVQDAIDDVYELSNSLEYSHVIYVDANWDSTMTSTGSVNAPYTILGDAVDHIYEDLGFTSAFDVLDATSNLGSYSILLNDGTYHDPLNDTIIQIAIDLNIIGIGTDVMISNSLMLFGGLMDGDTLTISDDDTITLTKLENLTIKDSIIFLFSEKNTIKNCNLYNCIVGSFGETFVFDSIIQIDSDSVVFGDDAPPSGIINFSEITFNNCELYKDGLTSLAMFMQSTFGGDFNITPDTKSRFLNCRYLSSDTNSVRSDFVIGGGSFDAMSSFFSGGAVAIPTIDIDNEDEAATYNNYIGNSVFINTASGPACHIDTADLNTTYLLSGNIGATYDDLNNVVLQGADTVGFEPVAGYTTETVENVDEALDDLYVKSKQVVYSSVDHSTPSPPSDVETIFDQYFTFPVNFAAAGAVFKLTASYEIVNDNGADTLTIRVRQGGLTGSLIIETNAYNATIGDTGVIFITGVVHEIGSAGHAHVMFMNSETKNSTNSMSGGSVDVPINTTVTLDLVVTYEWSSSSVDNQVQLETYLLETLS